MTAIQKYSSFAICLIAITMMTIVPLLVSADGTEGEIKKYDAGMAMSFVKNSGDEITVSVRISHRQEKQLIYGKDVEIQLFIDKVEPANLIGSQYTDEDGRASYDMNDRFYRASDSLTEYHFIAFMPENNTYNEGEEEIIVKKARLTLELYEEEGIRYAKAVLQKDSPGNLSPIPDTEVKFYVRRSFSLLPIGGGYTYTDEEGVVVIEFPNDLPGDENGKVEIVAKLPDNEDFGTLERRSEIDWGIPLVINHNDMKAKLWSSRKNAPISLVVISCVIILGIWGTICYLVVQLWRLKKIGEQLV